MFDLSSGSCQLSLVLVFLGFVLQPRFLASPSSFFFVIHSVRPSRVLWISESASACFWLSTDVLFFVWFFRGFV